VKTSSEDEGQCCVTNKQSGVQKSSPVPIRGSKPKSKEPAKPETGTIPDVITENEKTVNRQMPPAGNAHGVTRSMLNT